MKNIHCPYCKSYLTENFSGTNQEIAHKLKTIGFIRSDESVFECSKSKLLISYYNANIFEYFQKDSEIFVLSRFFDNKNQIFLQHIECNSEGRWNCVAAIDPNKLHLLVNKKSHTDYATFEMLINFS